MNWLLSLPRRVWNQGWLVLMYTATVWGCNAVAARLAVGEISPMCLVFLRWLIVCSILGWLMRKQIREHQMSLFYHWKRLVAMGIAGFTGFSALFYLAAYETTALNITLLQSAMPPMVMLGAWLLFSEKITYIRSVGMAMALTGVAVVATEGHLSLISSMSFNIGDMAILVACAFYAAYTLALRAKPALPFLVMFFGMSVAALVTSLPLAVGEIALDKAYWPSLTGWLVLLFVAFGPSLTAQLAYMRGVELLGPGRASLFPSLVPALGAFFAVLFLNEHFAPYHAVALGLGLGGVYLSEMQGRKFPILALLNFRSMRASLASKAPD